MVLGIATTVFIKKVDENPVDGEKTMVKADASDQGSLLTSNLVMFLVF